MPLLFSYGPLQEPDVQMATFGRYLRGQPDQLVGYQCLAVTVDDAAFVAASGRSEHAMVRFNGRPDNRVTGIAFEVTDDELARSDAYEPAGYMRVLATLESGREAWVYADARDIPLTYADDRRR
jgi:hypothetical protein